MKNFMESNIATSLTSVINIMGFDPKKVAEELTRQHRTLQEDFTLICIEYLKIVASKDYRYDVRNELSHNAAMNLLHPKKYMVITTYSWDCTTVHEEFDTYNEAVKYLINDFNNEIFDFSD